MLINIEKLISMKKTILLRIITLFIICFLTACKGGSLMNYDNPICGGIINNSYVASKEIKSENIVSLSCSYFLYGECGSEFDASYGINVNKNDEGKFILEEKRHNIKCEVDDDFLKAIQEIIKKNNLISKNGIDKYTSGLPYEYQPSYFDVEYDTGEKLYFRTNNDPRSPWGKQLLEITRAEFNKHGITDLNLPDSTKKIVNFDFTYVEDNIYHNFCEVRYPKEGVNKTFEEVATNGYQEEEYTTNVVYTTFDRSKDEPSDEYKAEINEAYYEGLSKIVEENKLKDYVSLMYEPSGFNYRDSKGYYEFNIEFEYGNDLKGFSNEPEDLERFAPIAKIIFDYIKDYLNIN